MCYRYLLGVKWSQVQILSADRYECRSEAILAHRTAGLNDRPTLSHVSCAGQTVCWRADTPPALVVTTAATALAQPTVTRALKTLNRGGIVVRDRHIDGEQIVFVEFTATARGAEECPPNGCRISVSRVIRRHPSCAERRGKGCPGRWRRNS
jgi:hypothetical protein